MEELHLPPFVIAEREALLAEIHETFAKVDRKGGVSWSEADVIDDYGTEEERAIARAKDRETRWQDLVEDSNWDPANGGRLCFVDAIGFRYYLPAAKVRAVRQGYDSGILSHLRLEDDEYRDDTQSKWMLLNLPQRLCIKRFLQYMGIVSAWREGKDEKYGWVGALNSYWGKFSNGEAVSETPADTFRRRQRSRNR